MSARRFVLLIPALACVLMARPAIAQQDVYKCVDDRGNVTFMNNGNTKGCTRVAVDPVVIPKAPNTAKSATSPSNFPKVDNGTQKVRDNDRRRILEDELRDKEARLAALKREYNNGEPERQGDERNFQRYLDRTARLKEDIARAEGDIASIRSEIERPRGRRCDARRPGHHAAS